ncbi:hypothetical protein [Promicromonospora soli]
MLTLRSFLERFRPAGTPGAAAQRGVPADRAADQTAELEPLLALLDDVESTAASIRHDAVADAARRHTEAAQEAAAIVARAHGSADAARAEVTARVRREAQDEASAAVAAGEERVAALRARVTARMPAYVDRVVDEVRMLVRELAEPTPEPGRDRS